MSEIKNLVRDLLEEFREGKPITYPYQPQEKSGDNFKSIEALV